MKLGKGRKSPILRWGLRGTEVQVYKDRNLQRTIRAVGQIQENLPPELHRAPPELPLFAKLR